MKILFSSFATTLFFASVSGEDRLTAAREFLDVNRVSTQEMVVPANYKVLHARIAASRDPETKFGPYIFALANSKSKVLSEEQLEKLRDVIEARRTNPVNWHDVRNIVRVQSLLAMWELAAATDEARVSELEREWQAWNELRLAYMFEELVMRDRFQRAAWAVFTLEQREKLVAGDYDILIKKNTGHRRVFSAHKQVLKALGKPQDKAAFDAAVVEWEKKWEAVTEWNMGAARFDRQREMAMDQADESFAVISAKESERVFSEFTRAERDAIRDLVQAGYAGDTALGKKAAATRDKLRNKMLTDYREHGEELLRRLGEIE